MPDAVVKELSAARDLLLDLSLRNRLLNFRPTRRTTIPIIDERPELVFEILVQRQKSVSFLAEEEHELFDSESGRLPDGLITPQPEKSAPSGFTLPRPETALETPAEPFAPRYTDRFLQTSLDAADLQTNLLRTHQAASSALEEKGANFLYLALGFVQWRRADQPDRELAAPLLLIPVSLVRTSARRRFRLEALEEDPVVNPCLAALLEREYGLALPSAPESWEEFHTGTFFQEVEKLLAPLPKWRVTPDIQLGLFSFTKYLMYLDLDPARWSSDPGLATHPLISALCGGGSLQALEDEPTDTDRIPPEDCHQVLDADASQLRAISAARAGSSFVLEGPPGTGKSQTITNVIAECLAAGKRVLFVAEKLAALQVVKRRLDRVGLGDFCLELHSTKANRRSVLAQVGRALESGRLESPADSAPAQKLASVRTRLNEYVEALHEPVGRSGISPYESIGRVLARSNAPEVPAGLPGLTDWDEAAIQAAIEQVERLARQLDRVWPPEQHPFRGALVRSLSANTTLSAKETLERLVEVLPAAGEASQGVSRILEAPEAVTWADQRRLLKLAKHFSSSPGVTTRLLSEPGWEDPDEDTKRLLVLLQVLDRHRNWAAERYRSKSLDSVDWLAIRRRYKNKWTSWVRVLRPGYWADRKVVREACREGFVVKKEQVLDDLEQLGDYQATRDTVKQLDPVGRLAFDRFWRGTQSDPVALQALADWLKIARRAIARERAGQAAITLAADGAFRDELNAAIGQLGSRLYDLDADWSQLESGLKLEENALFDIQLHEVELVQVEERLAQMLARFEALNDWARYQDILSKIQAGPLASFERQALANGVRSADLPAAFEKRMHVLLWEAACDTRSPLSEFNGSDRDADRLRFAKLDRGWLSLTSLRLQAKLSALRPTTDFGAADSSRLGILLGEIRRKRGGRSIRRLIADTEQVLTRCKPCFMMSPLSVAQYLAAGSAPFDVVIFDEASQVEPSDALGAVARARQLILVGDSNQLPPTAFFKSMAGDADREPPQGAAGLADMESILDRGASVLPSLNLQWHFRSRHDSLIAFSNRHFYENRLVVFPACDRSSAVLGVQVIHHPEDTYDRGGTQTNLGQARRIAAWVFDQARTHPDKSLGVGAFSKRQQQAILDEIETLRIQDDSLEAFFSTDQDEPFFVKNLETIQGDERDVIVLSVGYGKKSSTDRLSMNFGPLNQDGGWRRLNVLITRARERCVIFTSIRPEDFDLDATDARGVRALHGYLKFAFSDHVSLSGTATGQTPEGFKAWVHDALIDRGLPVQRRIGLSEQPIELAVADPARPERLVLGLEFDGPAYRGAATARDRERLRQQVLEGLGWRIHRVWAPDWLRTPERELDRVEQAAADAALNRLEPSFAWKKSKQEDRQTLRSSRVSGEELGFAAYTLYRSDEKRKAAGFYKRSQAQLADEVAEIVKVEGPIHEDEVIRRLAEVWGIGRAGAKVRKKGQRALERATLQGIVEKRGEFLWPPGMENPPVRSRDDERLRDSDRICTEELGQAAVTLLEIQFGMDRADLVTQTARALGFSATGSKIAAAVERAIDAEIKRGRIVRTEGILTAQTNTPPGIAAPPPKDLPPPIRPVVATTIAANCSKCSKSLKPGARFCPECGARVEVEPTMCRSCGKPLKPNARFCDDCGTKVL